ncbi:YncE family protein [Micromonospora sp. NPDC049559]|uniref:YncE family protein n=1 Tax=Micromonospora sp. NPDC049559 TaxID=3155923 RepID=UPI00341684EC
MWILSVAVVLLGLGPAPAGAARSTPADPGPAATSAQTREVLLVGNNWDGTADIVDVRTYQRIRRINVIPDREARLAEIYLSPVRLAAFLFIRTQIGEGHDQFVDDMYASADGRLVYVSRPSFGDVVAIDIQSGEIRWRTRVDGERADHMAISPDGSRLAVSASTAKLVDMIDTATGQIVGTFPSGDSPHENTYSRDGGKIYHASIGAVYTTLDEPWLDWTKGERVFEIVDARTLRVERRVDIRQKLAEFGMPDMSAAVRPMALSPDERFAYLQVSFLHGFVEYDLRADRVTRVAQLPLSDEARQLRRDQYVLDSAHHGIAMSGDGTKLCVAGTMSNYAAIVSRDSFRHSLLPLGARTYWATSSADGQYCYVSVAGDDTVSVISYATEQQVARIPVGDHPQRARTATVAESALG